MTQKPLKFKRNLKDIGTGYVVRNLLLYGNSIVPTELFNELSEETVAKLLTIILEKPVTIIKTRNGYKAEL